MVWTNPTFPRTRGWNPWRELDRLQAEFRGLFEGFNGAGVTSGGAYPRINVHKHDDGATLAVLVPGFAQEDIEIQVDGDIVTLTARRPEPEALAGETSARRELAYGEFRRSLRLPFEIDADATSAKLEGGVLELKLPKTAQLKPRTITVNTG